MRSFLLIASLIALTACGGGDQASTDDVSDTGTGGGDTSGGSGERAGGDDAGADSGDDDGSPTGAGDGNRPDGGSPPDGSDGSDPDGSDPDGSDPDGSDPDGSDPDGSDPDGSDPDGSDPDGSDPDGSDPDGSDPDGSDPDGSDPDGSGSQVSTDTSSAVSGAVALTWPDEAPRYGVWEATLDHEDSGYGNPFDDLWLTARITDPAGQSHDVDGYYHDTDTWKLRFAPDQAGTYQFSLSLAGETLQGSFASVEVGKRGFIRKHPTNPYRMVYERTGALFVLNGFNMDFLIRTGASDDPVEAYLDGMGYVDRQLVGIDAYYQAFATEAGLNAQRVFNNAQPSQQGFRPMYASIDPGGNRYDLVLLKYKDHGLQKARAHGVRILFGLFGWDDTYHANLGDADRVAAIQRYVRYINARYGAYVDFWEINNECNNTSMWLDLTAGYLRGIDPYDHMISTSWERPDHPEIDLHAPHAGWQWNEAVWDQKAADYARDGASYPRADHPMPMVFTEAGNSLSGTGAWHQDTLDLTRTKLWVTYFRESANMWWPGQYGSVEFKPELRRVFAVFAKFWDDNIDRDVQIGSGASVSGASGPRVYELRSDSDVYCYLYNPSRTATATGVTLTLEVPEAGLATWMNPTTGTILDSFYLSAGSQQLDVPDFVMDMVLKVVSNRPADNPPTVDAGQPTSTTLPDNTVDLDGTVTDPDGAVNVGWGVVSGGNVRFADASAVDTTASFDASGDHVLSLTADDGNNAPVTATVQITVYPVPVDAPVVSAGSDRSTSLGNGSLELNGSVTGAAGTASLWTVISGSGVTFSDDTDPASSASFTSAGAQVLQLEANDGVNPPVVDTMVVLVEGSGFDRGPTAHWKLDDTSGGSIADATGNGNVGTLHDMDLGTASEAGVDGRSLRFDGIDDYITFADSPSFDHGPGGQMSVSMWVRPVQHPGGYAGQISSGILFAKGEEGQEFYLRLLGSQPGMERFRFRLAEATYEPPPTERPRIDTWYHVLCLFDGRNLRMFVDGVELLDANPTLSSPPPESNDRLVMGKRSPSDAYFQNGFVGNLDDVRFYDRALLGSEIQTLASGGNPDP